ncbi:MAG: hypothetical protein HUJ54_12630 [Erysipelotrichaceae bacterium]|nr:hypothetical protein [Erysipelotrichaceae bacterium]
MQQDKPVNKSDVQPGEYYIYKTEDRVFNTIYSLIKIDEIYEKGGVFGYGTTRTAKYTQERMNSSGEISLDKARLYEVLPLACEESHPDLLFTPEGRSYPCDRYGIPFWSDSMCDEHPIDQNSVRPGRYYIYRTYDRHLNHIYSLIKIDEIYNKERPWNLPPEKAAKYTPANGGDSGEIYLSIACLYEVPSYSSGEDRDELPEWDESMCNERIDPYDLQPGRYYICMTYIRDQAEPFNKIYRLAKVNDVFDSQICPELSGEEYAEIEFPETGIKRQISLNPAKYDSYLDRYYFYEIPD